MKDYSKKTLRLLKALATKHFNAFIRERDQDQPCISCGSRTTLQAGHFYSGGHHSALRFNEDNVHGQCMRCNYYLSGNLNEYRKNLIKKIGVDRVEQLDMLAAYHKRKGYKWDRFFLIDIINKYKKK